MQDKFNASEQEYLRLRGLWAVGRITREQFDEQLRGLMLQDAQGRFWMLGAESGKWYMNWDGNWVEATPTIAVSSLPTDLPERGLSAAPRVRPPNAVPPFPVSPSSAASLPPPMSGRPGCGRQLACGCLVLLLACVLLVAAGYFALSTGALTQRQLLLLAGQGPADIEVMNFRDETVYMTVTSPPTSEGDRSRMRYEFASFDVAPFYLSSAGRYTLEFGRTTSGVDLGTCVLTARSGDQFQFVTLPDGILIHHVNQPQTNGADLNVATSALCR